MGAGCTSTDTPQEETATEPAAMEAVEAFTYEMADVPAMETVSFVPFSDLYTAETLASQATECGTEFVEGHFEAVYEVFKDATVQKHTFTYLEEAQGPDTYVLYAMANEAGYKTFDEFKADFDICAVGGTAYPSESSSSYLLLSSTCGSGYDDESGLPHGCTLIQDALTVQITE